MVGLLFIISGTRYDYLILWSSFQFSSIGLGEYNDRCCNPGLSINVSNRAYTLAIFIPVRVSVQFPVEVRVNWIYVDLNECTQLLNIVIMNYLI